MDYAFETFHIGTALEGGSSPPSSSSLASSPPDSGSFALRKMDSGQFGEQSLVLMASPNGRGSKQRRSSNFCCEPAKLSFSFGNDSAPASPHK